MLLPLFLILNSSSKVPFSLQKSLSNANIRKARLGGKCLLSVRILQLNCRSRVAFKFALAKIVDGVVHNLAINILHFINNR